MNKTISFEWKGKPYTLEFTKKSIAKMERAGFVAEDVKIKPMSTLPELFAGAFLQNHPFEKRKTIDEILDHMTNRTELFGKLVEMFNAPFEGLMGEPEETEGNVTWVEN